MSADIVRVPSTWKRIVPAAMYLLPPGEDTLIEML